MRKIRTYCLTVMLTVGPGLLCKGVEVKNLPSELQRVPAEMFVMGSIDWLLEWRQIHYPVVNHAGGSVVIMLIRFGGIEEDHMETVAVTEVREPREAFGSPDLPRLIEYRVTHIRTTAKGTISKTAKMAVAGAKPLINKVWNLVSNANIDTPLSEPVLGRNDTWYCIGAAVDADGRISSSRQMGQVLNPTKESSLWKLRSELISDISNDFKK